MKTIKIAIDGPAGAGKSTISKIVSKKLNYIYIDTGAMYRAVALYAIRKGVNTKNADEVSDVLDEIDINIDYKNDAQQIFLNGENVSDMIRTPEVSVGASDVAVITNVRLKLVELQRKLAETKNVIMDGRDIGTYVLPNADVKIFLTATCDERARRRYEELLQKGVNCTFDEVKSDMQYRDKNDSEREFAPLKAADDAVVVDTTGFSQDESVKLITETINKRLGK